jgi:hypothetical protein
LSVDIISFNGNRVQNGVQLTWKVANEVNFNRFVVERAISVNSSEFKAIASVNAQAFKTYNTLDKTPMEGINYYRLKMVDNDGTVKYSKLVNVTFDDNLFATTVNPVENGQIVIMSNAKAPKFALRSVNGTKVEFTSSKNGANFVLGVKNVTPGIYILEVKDKGAVVAKKLYIK